MWDVGGDSEVWNQDKNTWAFRFLYFRGFFLSWQRFSHHQNKQNKLLHSSRTKEKTHLQTLWSFPAVAEQSDIIPADGEPGPNRVVKPKLVVGRNAVIIYCTVSTTNGRKDALGSSGVHSLMERNGCQLI